MAYTKGFKLWALMIKPVRCLRTPGRNIICRHYHHDYSRAINVGTKASMGFPGRKGYVTSTKGSCSPATSRQAPVFHHDENMNAIRILQSMPNYKCQLFEYDEDLIRGGEIQAEAQAASQGSASVSRTSFKPGVPLRSSVLRFIDAAYSSQEHQLPITHPKNEDSVNKVMKELKQLNDTELCQVLYHMRQFPPCPSGRDPPFQKIWSQLDQECRARSESWSLDFSFVVADLWYGIGLARMSEFHYTMIKRLFRKCDKLKKEHLVRLLFCLNVNRELPPSANSYDLEYNVQRVSDQLTAEEIVIIAMAFFKTQRPIRDPDLIKKLLTTAMKSSKTLESVSVAAIAKLARYSTDNRSAQVIYDFQEGFLPEIPRLSNSACTHLALTGTNSLSPHKELIQTIVNKMQGSIGDARLKELERISLAATMFNMDCDQLCDLVSMELQRPERADEIRKYGRCLPAILHYLSIKNIFIPDLMSMCLSKTFRDTYYGRGREIFQRELLCLDVAADIEATDYTGHRLEDRIFNLIMKKNMLWVKPPSKLRVSVYERFVRSVTEALNALLEDKEMFYLTTILPQHHTMAVVYCRDMEGKLVPIPQYYYDIAPHHVKKIQNNPDLSYHAVMLCGRSLYLWKNKDITGQGNLQIRQTGKLGYKTQLILNCDWGSLVNMEERRCYLEKILEEKT